MLVDAGVVLSSAPSLPLPLDWMLKGGAKRESACGMMYGMVQEDVIRVQ